MSEITTLRLPLELMDVTGFVQRAEERRYAVLDDRGQQVAICVYTIGGEERSKAISGAIRRCNIAVWDALCEALDAPHGAHARSRGELFAAGADGVDQMLAALMPLTEPIPA